VITGAVALSGGRAATVPDGADRTVAEPAPFVAVTRTRRRNPTSSAVSGYVLDVAPGTSVQLVPVASQRTHWYAYVAWEPLHVPGSAVRVCPSRGVPEIVGGAVLSGAAGFTEAGAEVAVAFPAAFVAFTTTRMRFPVSAATVVYVA
jgi:hypothetical protein